MIGAAFSGATIIDEFSGSGPQCPPHELARVFIDLRVRFRQHSESCIAQIHAAKGQQRECSQGALISARDDSIRDYDP